MTKRERFIEEFNALLKKYKVTLSVRERIWAMETVAEGVDFYFDWDDTEGNIEDIECGMCFDEIIEVVKNEKKR